MSVNDKMIALADEVRELSGTTDKMGIDAMTSTLNTENTSFNTNITTQEDLIADIKAALADKAVGSAPNLQSKNVTPGVNEQKVTPDSGYDGLSSVTVAGDSNLVAENIVSGVSIFGVEGNAATGGASVETCTGTLAPVTGSTFIKGAIVTFINSSQQPETINLQSQSACTITTIKNSLICSDKTNGTMISGGMQISNNRYAFFVTEDFEIKFI